MQPSTVGSRIAAPSQYRLPAAGRERWYALVPIATAATMPHDAPLYFALILVIQSAVRFRCFARLYPQLQAWQIPTWSFKSPQAYRPKTSRFVLR